MDRAGLTILVTGGTGHQGGAAARHLLADGWRVSALVRDAAKPAAMALRDAGAELVLGDLLDPASLARAAEGAYGVYSVQTPFGAGAGDEETEGINLAKAAQDAGVSHFVYSSVRGADDPGEVAYAVSKHRIEEYLADSGLAVTVWRPVTFMENFLRQRDDILAGHLTGPQPAEALKQMIAVDDIGRFAALAFSDPARFVGVTMEIESDEMPWGEVAATFQRVLGRPVEYVESPAAFPAMASKRVADLSAVRALIPDLVRLEEWVRGLGWV